MSGHLAPIHLALVFGMLAGSAVPAASDCQPPAEAAAERPAAGAGPTPVEVGVYVIDVSEIDDVSQSFSADLYLFWHWHDPRLSESALGASLEGCPLSTDQIWNPAADVVNQRSLTTRDAALRVGADGEVRMRRRLTGQLSSPLDLRDFPFDHQVLPVTVASFLYGPRELALTVDSRTGGSPDFSLAGWQLELGDHEVGVEHVASADRDVARVDFRLRARRNSGYYLWKMLLPLSLIVFMAWTVFWIDPVHFGPQVGVSTAAVFTLIAFQLSLGQLLPKVSYLTRADRFILGSTLLVFLALAEAILAGRLAGEGREAASRRLDVAARWIYPTLFALHVLTTFEL